ncbi:MULTISPECIES: GNAT family N-acetyltransferase [unclassified Corynebacterium]|nr:MULTISPECIES: GNAT family N-acetyltransferase [unclassified Corynebacterium]
MGTNVASIKLHEKLGFANVGTFKEVSYKRGHWLNLAHLQLLV